MTVTLDRMIHTNAVHQELGKEIGLEGCCAFGGKGEDLNPIDLVAMGVASCMLIVMAKGAEGKGLDLTGAWAETSYELKDYKIASIAVNIHSPCSPSAADRAFLEKESHRCPVYLSVKDSVSVKVAFEWGTTAAPAAKKAGKSCASCS
ncbi:MAG: OsmC family protein [Thermoguttaceae bacterium]